MSNKPIIEIDVNAEKFKAFYDLFQQYAQAVEDMPDDWKKINGATENAGKSIADFEKHSSGSKEALMLAAIQADAIGKAVGEAIAAQKEFFNVTQRGASALENAAKHAKSLGSEISGIGRILGSIGSGVFGLATGAAGLAVAGVTGMHELAKSAVDDQRAARRIGVNNGELKAFSNDFGRYVDPSMLNTVADAQSDMNKLPYLMMASGMHNLNEVQAAKPTDLAVRILKHANEIGNDPKHPIRSIQELSGTGLDRFMSFEDFRQAKSMTPKEFSEAQSHLAGDAKSSNVTDEAVDKLHSFNRELSAAGNALKADLTNNLANLAPDMQESIKQMTEFGKSLGGINGAIERLSSTLDGVTKFAKDAFGEEGWSRLGHAETKILAMLGDKDAQNTLKLTKDNPVPSGTVSKKQYAPTITDKQAAAYKAMQDPNLRRLMQEDAARHPSSVPASVAHVKGNNPGNLRAAPGVSSTKGFAQFASLEDGIKAMAWTINGYPSRHHADTLRKMISTYAPPKENNTAQYIKNVASWTGFNPDAHLSIQDPKVISKIISAMVRQESGLKISADEVISDIKRSHWNAPGKTGNGDFSRLIAAIERLSNTGVRVSVTNSTAARVAVSTNAAAATS